MPRGLQYGRRLRIRVGNQIATDIDPTESFETNEARTLDCVFSTEGHLKLAPFVTTVKVFGFNRNTRNKLTEDQNAAAAVAWEKYQDVQSGAVLVEDEQIAQFQQQLVFQGGIVTIEAGYQDDFALIAKAQIVPDGVEHEWSESGWVTTITAQDNRYPWQNSFVSETQAPGVRIVELQAALDISERFLTGEVTEAVVRELEPSLLETKNFGGYANGRVLHGDSRNFQQEIADRLGYRRFLDRGQLRYIKANETTLDEAVLLRLVPVRDRGEPVPGGMHKFKMFKRGFVEATTLLNHRLEVGRQVVLQDDTGAPIGGGTFRVDYDKHAGTSFEQTYNSMVTLRPVTTELTKNI